RATAPRRVAPRFGAATGFGWEREAAHAAQRVVAVGRGLIVGIGRRNGPESEAAYRRRGIARAARLVERVGRTGRQDLEGAVVGRAARVLRAAHRTAGMPTDAGIGVRVVAGDLIAVGIVGHRRADLPAGGKTVARGATVGIAIFGRDQPSG